MANQYIKLALILPLVFFIAGQTAQSSKLTELQDQIKNKNEEISKIVQEIKKYQEEITKTLQEKTTLNTQLKQLQATADKLRAEIKLTSKKIENTNYVLEELAVEISDKNIAINNSKEFITEIIKNINEEESRSLLEILLAHNNLSEFFDNLQRMEYLTNDIKTELDNLKSLKNELEISQEEKNKEKNKLETLNTTLGDQQKIAETNKKQKNTLLTITKNKESVFRTLLQEQVEKREKIEQEISDIEQQIRIEIDPKSLPSAGSGVLAWPLENVVITQYFGNTPFATQNPQVYNGKGHNGVDFRASVGTALYASKSGVITGIGDTDTQCKGVSYGKWVLIEHDNNLSTLYAHLSLIKVHEGQKMVLGEIIGYSGDTGYVTGPHLHFAVFATPAVRITEYKSKVCGTLMRLPLSSSNGYLNPLSYL